MAGNKDKLLIINDEKKGYGFKALLIENRKVKFITKYFLLFALLSALGVFGILNPSFLNIYNILNILKTTSIVGLIAIAAMINLNAGSLNFCLGTQSTLTAAVIAVLLDRYTGSYLLAVIAGYGASMIVCCILNFFISVLKLRSFITTLALSTILLAIDQGLTGSSEMFSTNWPGCYTFIGRTKLFGILPLPVGIFLLLGGICWFVLERTRLGRHQYACGANIVTSELIRINITRMKFLSLMMGSLLAATAGLVQTSVLNSVNPTMGNDLLIPAISSAMLGSTFLTPGKYNVPGTMIAAFLTTTVKLGVAGLGAGSFVSDIVQGIILIISVGFIALVREEGLPKVSLT